MDLNGNDGGAAWVPQACTLPAADRPGRMAEFDEVFAQAVRAVERAGPSRMRLDLDPGPGVAGRIAELAAAESGCCSFFTFILTVTGGRLLLEVTVPAAQTAVLDALAARAAALSRGAA